MKRLGVIGATTVGLVLSATTPSLGAQVRAVEVAQTDPVAADQLEGSAPSPAAPASPPAAPAATPATNAPSTEPSSPSAAANPAATDTRGAPLPEFSKALPVAPAPADGAPATTGAITPPAPEPPSPNAAPAGPQDAVPVDATPAQAVAPPVHPVLAEIRNKLENSSFVGRSNSGDVDALKAFYGADTPPVWTKDGAYTDAANALIAELGKAGDWGLNANDYITIALASGASPEAQANAEAQLAMSALKYARDARGGRVDPRSVSNIWDVGGEVKDPATVMKDLAASSTPDAVLRDLQPKHPDFEALRQALLKTRGAAEPAPEPVDEALLVKLPEAKRVAILKVGQSNDDVLLLRKRLKVAAADGDDERVYDAALSEAVRGFQSANGLKATGTLNRSTRRALNREGEPKKPADRDSTIDNLIVNMERWRWLPADMGSVYVWSNVPEFMGRVMKNDAPIFEERIIVGLPTWPTPMLTDSLEKVVFNPEWGVPDGIKVKELLPRLRRASGDDFFSALFGGSSGGGRVLAAYGLKPSLNGRPVDPDAINWNNVDIRRFSFVQPPGAKNPLGRVKFMFPNRHDVYMHDTSERALFAQTRRALSHGCIRVQNPEKLAQVLLAEDKGWGEDQVAGRFRSGGEVLLDKPVPVYLTYFTARPNADGTVKTFADIYGHDSRVLSAIAGRPVRYTPPDHSDEVVADDATVMSDPYAEPATQPVRKKGKQARKKSGGVDEAGDIISNALSGLLFN